MTQHVVTLTAEVLVTVDSGGPSSAARLVKEHVANGWLLNFQERIDREAGHYVLKGLSGAVSSVKPWLSGLSGPREEEPDRSSLGEDEFF